MGTFLRNKPAFSRINQNYLSIFFIFKFISFWKMNYKLLINYYWFVINIIWHTCYFLRQLLMFIISAERLNCQSSFVHHTHVNNALRVFECRNSQHERIIRKHEHLLIYNIIRGFQERKLHFNRISICNSISPIHFKLA